MINRLIAVSAIFYLIVCVISIFLLIYYSFTGHRILLDEASGLYIDARGEEDFISNILSSYWFAFIFKSQLMNLIVGIAPKFLVGTTIIPFIIASLIYFSILILMIIIGFLCFDKPMISKIIFTICSILSLPLLVGIVTIPVPVLLILLTYRLFSVKPKMAYQ